MTICLVRDVPVESLIDLGYLSRLLDLVSSVLRDVVICTLTYSTLIEGAFILPYGRLFMYLDGDCMVIQEEN